MNLLAGWFGRDDEVDIRQGTIGSKQLHHDQPDEGVRRYTEARLDAIAVGVGRSAYDKGYGGARVAVIRNRPAPARPRTTSPAYADPELRAAQKEAAQRGTLIGVVCVHCVQAYRRRAARHHGTPGHRGRG